MRNSGSDQKKWQCMWIRGVDGSWLGTNSKQAGYSDSDIW